MRTRSLVISQQAPIRRRCEWETDTRWASAATGRDHTVAIKTGGTLWAWGLNEQGQVGDGTTFRRLAPVRVGTDTHWASITAGGQMT